MLINGHYRQALNFTFDALDAARASLARVDECVDALAAAAGSTKAGEAPPWALACRKAFADAINDDLNLPEAFAALFSLVREGNTALHQGGLSPEASAAVLQVFDELDSVLGVIRFGRAAAGEEVPPEVATLVEARASARTNKNWAEADRLRNELAARGWEVRDSKDGQKVKRL